MTIGAPVARNSLSTPSRSRKASAADWKTCVESVSRGNVACSTSATDSPARASSVASGEPAHRPPTTTTSNSLPIEPSDHRGSRQTCSDFPLALSGHLSSFRSRQAPPVPSAGPPQSSCAGLRSKRIHAVGGGGGESVISHDVLGFRGVGLWRAWGHTGRGGRSTRRNGTKRGRELALKRARCGGSAQPPRPAPPPAPGPRPVSGSGAGSRSARLACPRPRRS